MHSYLISGLLEVSAHNNPMAYSYKSAISFGLVYVPVTLHATVKSHDIGFNMLHKKSGERIRYKKTCDSCGANLSPADIVRGFEYEKGKYVTISDKELEDLKSEKDKSIEISQFVNLSDIDPIYFEKSYYVQPKGAEKAFKLILHALGSENKVGIAKTVLGSKEQLVALRAINGNMILYTMHFYNEIQKNPAKEVEDDVGENEIDLAKQIIDNMTTKFDPKQFKDEYRMRLEKAIAAKIDGRPVTRTKSSGVTKVMNLMDALKASVENSTKTKTMPGKVGKNNPSKRKIGRA